MGQNFGRAANDYAEHIAIGPDGYVYVTGDTSSFGSGLVDIFLLTLDQKGDLQWARTWGGSSDEGGYDIGFDSAGNVYVSGESYSNGNCAVVLKFSSADGSLLWETSWKGPATYDSAYALTVDKLQRDHRRHKLGLQRQSAA